MNRAAPTLLVVLVAVSSACGGETSDDSRRALLASWGEHVILPGYRDFETTAESLHDAAETLCNAPSSEALRDARSAWWDARAPWKQNEILAFGPYREEPLRLGPKIDFWPVRVDAIEQILSDTSPIAADALGAAARGFPVIEYLLYQPDTDIVTDFAASPRRCEYLLAITDDLAHRAREMRRAWDPAHGDYLGELVEAGRTGAMFDNPTAAVGEIVNRMAFAIENIRADKLGRPLGATTGGSPQPDKAESRFSGRSLDDIRDNLRGIERLYFGDGSQDSKGLDFYTPRDKGFARAMQDQLAAAREVLDQIPMPLTVAVIEQPAPVSATIDQLGELQRLIQVDIINALGLTPRFNDNDGD